MITERTLKKWRREALVYQGEIKDWNSLEELTKRYRALNDRVIRMTQVLLDQHLMKKEVQ